MTPDDILWERYPCISSYPHAPTWLTIQCQLQLAQNTIEAYARALEDYLRFCYHRQVNVS